MDDGMVYLCGPINGCTDDQAHTWRELVKAELGEDRCLDPMRRDYRGREEECVIEIVEEDKLDIDLSTVVLANCWTPSPGTSMEIIYSWEQSVPVVAVVPPDSKVSPWITYHSLYVVTTLEKGVSLVKELLHA